MRAGSVYPRPAPTLPSGRYGKLGDSAQHTFNLAEHAPSHLASGGNSKRLQVATVGQRMNNDKHRHNRCTNAAQSPSGPEGSLSHRRNEDLPQEIRMNSLVIYDAFEHCRHSTRSQLCREQLVQSDPHRLDEKTDQHLIYRHPAAGDEAYGQPEKPRKANSSLSTQKLFQHLHVPGLFASVVSKTLCLARILDALRLLSQHLNTSALEDDSNAKYAQNLWAPIPRTRRNLCERKRTLLALDKDTIPAFSLEYALHATSTEESCPESLEPFNRIARWPCG
jgi:hypothetical protein